MKRKSTKNFLIVLTLLSSFMVTTSFAQQQGGGAGGSSGDGADYLIGGYGIKQRDSKKSFDDGGNMVLFVKSPSFDDNFLASSYYFNLAQLLGANITLTVPNPKADKNTPQTFTDNGVFNVITATNSKALNLLAMPLANPINLDSSNNLYFLVGGSQAKTQTASGAPNVANLTIDSLIKPVMYSSQKDNNNQTVDQQANALQFINNVANQYNPVTVIDFSKLTSDQLSSAFQNQQVLQYINTIRSLAASYSVGMSNLAFLLSERAPQKTATLLGGNATNVPLPQQYQQNLSPLAYDQWSATRRLMRSAEDSNNQKSWNAKMEKATPATLQRETVYLLAEIRQELFQNRMTQERILATLSAMELQSNTANNIQIGILMKNICSTTLKGTGACPPMPTPGGA